MNKLIIFILSLTLLTIGCRSKKAQSKTPTLIFQLDKTGGRTIAPSYTLKIYDNGKAIYEGKNHTDKIGKYEMKISKDKLRILKEVFDKSNFFSFKDEYTSMVTDLQTTYIMYATKGKSKRIRDYHGAPEELKKLERILESVASGKDWEKMNE